MAYKVFIDGGHGTTGLEIRERLAGRDDIQLVEIDEAYRKDLAARAEAAGSADVTIMCLPDDASRELADALPSDVRLIDTSTAHRVDPGWVYGMPELYPGKRDEIRNASRVANPGCHATGFILLARPLVDASALSSKSSLSCFCVTGYSGGGRKMIEDYDRRHAELLKERERAEQLNRDGSEGQIRYEGSELLDSRSGSAGQGVAAAFSVSPAQYALGQSHKHLPEMKKMSGLENAPVFCPVVGDFYRGMVMTVEIPGEELRSENVMGQFLGNISRNITENVRALFEERYKDEPLIRVTDGPEDGFLYSDTMAMSDGLEIMVLGNDERLILASRFDNLGKGASGAAVQNLNIMLGIDELKGLSI